jgi:dihydrofolate reductase
MSSSVLDMSMSLDGCTEMSADSLLRERLADEYRLTVHPVMLGAGGSP